MNDFKIGADPEFSVIDRTHHTVGADLFLDRSPLKQDGYGPLGADGNGTTFEIRPQAAFNPLQLVANIHKLFAGASHRDHRLFGLEWRAGSFYDGFPLGGHIHFGVAGTGLNYDSATDLLDSYLGPLSILIEHKEEARKRRIEGGYGVSHTYRRQQWGFEYRCPSSWLTSPYVAAAVLCLAKTVMYEMLLPKDTLLRDHGLGGGEKSAIDHCDFIAIRKEFPSIWEEVTRMQLYQQYKPYIDLIYRLIDKRMTWFPATSLRIAWGVANVSVPMPRRIGLDTIWSQYRQDSLHAEGEYNQ